MTNLSTSLLSQATMESLDDDEYVRLVDMLDEYHTRKCGGKYKQPKLWN